MGEKINVAIEYDHDVAKMLREMLPYAYLVIDTETSGSDRRKHGLLSIGAISLHDPNLNYYGTCHLRDNAQISQADIKKNEFGWGQNIAQIINPNAKYPALRESNSPFLEPNDPSDYDMSRYMELERIISAILGSKVAGEGYIKESENGLIHSFYNWITAGRDSFPFIQYLRDQPSIVPIGHNISFDTGFINDAFARSGLLGSIAYKRVQFEKKEEQEFKNKTPFQFAYRGNIDTGQLVVSHIIELYKHGRGNEVEQFWKNSKTNTAQEAIIPSLQGQPGLTLDACMEYVGLEPRANTFSGKPHDAFYDAKITLEVAARILTGKPYLAEFSKYPVNTMLKTI